MLRWFLGRALLLPGRLSWLVLTPTGSASAALPAQQAQTRQQQQALPQQALSTLAQAGRLAAEALWVRAAWTVPALVRVHHTGARTGLLQDSLRLAWLQQQEKLLVLLQLQQQRQAQLQREPRRL